MKKYRRKEEVVVWIWTGDKSVIDEINEVIKSYEGYGTLSVGVTDDGKILCLSHTRGGGTGTQYIRFGEYVIYDAGCEDMPLNATNADLIKKNYIAL
jgi:hypothetical protein